MPNSASPGSPGPAGQEPGRHSILSPTGGKNSPKDELQREISRENSANKDYANPPTGVGIANLAVARGDVTSGLPPATSSNGAARALRNWADCPEDQGPGADDDFTVVRTKKRRRESANSPTAAAPSSNIGGARTSRRPQSSAGSVPRAQEIRTTRAHITEARARQASSSEDLCVYLEHGPELQPFHYLRALDRMLGGTAGVIQVSKVNGHQLLGLANRGLAERLINEGLEVEGTLLRAFPFRKRAERITVGNLPFFVEDSAIISALKPYGRVTSIAPKLMKAGPYTYNDGRREAFIVLREGMTTERLPTRLEIPIKGEAWPAYLSSGIKCSRCHGQGHRRANCPLLAGRTNAPRPATPISPTSVPSVTAPGLPRQPSAHPPPPASPSPAMETPSASPAARAVTPSAAPRPSTPVAPAVPVEMAPPAPPPVTPAPSLRAPGGSVSPQSTKSGPPAQDIEMTAIEESSASSTSSSRTSMRDDLVAFIQRSPTVSFTGTDALGLGREEVLDLLSSRTKAQRKRGLLTPPQTDALAGLIEQILGLKPAGNTNVYKILHQVKSELKKGPAAVPPTPPLPAPRPAGPTPPVPHGVETKPAMATPPPPLPTPMEEEYVDHEDLMEDLFDELNSDTELKPLLDSGFSTYDLIEAILHRNERALLIAQLSPSQKIIFAGFIDITVRPRVARAPRISLLASDESAVTMPNSASPGSPGPAGQEPGRHSILSPTGGKNSPKDELQREISRENSANKDYANPPTGVGIANLAVARGDVTSGLPPATSSNGAARALRNWADCPEDQGPGADDDFTVVRTKKRRRESANSPTAAAPSSNIGGARTSRRPQSSAGSVPRAQEIRTTRAHITEARARQASSSEDLCVYLEHGPELQPFHYLRALDRMLGGTAGVIQVSKVNGHQLLGLANRGLAERLINEGLEVEGTLLRAFPFRKRAERITVGNLPFFVEDSAIISALKPYGRVTSIAPKLMKAGPYTYNDGRREAFIVLREGMTTERLPTRLEIPIKGEAWPAYLSSGIKCSRCHGQGHRRANCPLLAGRTNAPRPATPISPTSVPSVTAPGLPRQPSAHPPPPASPSPAMETPSASPAARAVTPSAAPRPSTPVAPAVPVEMAPPAPPPVTPAPSLRAPGGSVSPQSTKSGPPAQDIEMTAIEESSASSTSSSRTSMRDDLVAFIQRSPTVSFTGTDALGLGREEVLDLLSSRTKAQRKRGLLTPPQTDALAGLIEQILGLKPAGNTNVYKILHQVKSELKKGPAAVPPTPPLPAPRPAGPTPPVPHGVETKPAMATPPPPLPTPMEEEYVDHEDLMEDLFDELNSDTELKPLLDSGFSTYDLIEAILHRNERALLIAQLSPSQKIIFAEFQKYVNLPAGGQHANPAAPTNFDTASFSEAAAQANRSWADLAEDNNPEHEDNYTTVQRKKRRRGSAESPAAAAPSSNIRGAGAIRRPRSSTGWAPRAEEIRTTRAHIAEARARQASSTEDHCVYVERSPELEPFHYIRAIERMFGSTREVFQVTKMNGHFLVGLANRGMAERLVNEGLEVEGTLHRAFPFRKRAERITVGNLPFFVGDATVISALSAFGRVTSIAPKLMKAGPYIYNDGRREAFIILREGMTIEGLPTRLNINIKGEAWPAYLSSGIRCSRCRGQGHRRANCPLLAGRTNAPGPATPTSPTSVPSATAPGLPQQPSAQPPPSASPSPTLELSDVPPASCAALLPPAAPRPPPPAPLALPVEDTSPAPPPVIPAPSLRAPGGSVNPQSSKSEPSARDIEMTAIEESSASSTSSSRTSMRDDLVAFIRRSPTVSFTGTDALGLGREEVLDLLSSRTKAQRKRWLLTPPQTDALAGLIEQILGLKPAGNTNVYKILHQVKSELKKGPAAVPPTPPLPAPRPAGPTPPVPHGVETKPAMATPPPPLPTPMEEKHVDHEDLMEDLFDELNSDTELKPLLDSGFS
ncbi:hypothetical protein LAZ67_20002378, partial [Cordylochernes scorpioides]